MKVLRINRSSSECGECGRSADPYEKGHYTLLGYGPDNGKPGCGAIWTHVTTDYIGLGSLIDSIKSMRPDLELIDPHDSLPK